MNRHEEGIEKAAAAFYNDPSGLTDWARMSEKDPALAEKYRVYISAAVKAYEAHMRPALEASLFEIEQVHHIHGHSCLCGFTSARSRSRTEHITGFIRDALGGDA